MNLSDKLFMYFVYTQPNKQIRMVDVCKKFDVDKTNIFHKVKRLEKYNKLKRIQCSSIKDIKYEVINDEY